MTTDFTALAADLEILCGSAADEFIGMAWESDAQTALKVARRSGGIDNHGRAIDILEEEACGGSWAGRGNGPDQADFRRRLREAAEASDVDALAELVAEEAEDVAADAAEAAEYGANAVAALRAGDIREAADMLERACALERSYGDDPSWSPVRAWFTANVPAPEDEDEVKTYVVEVEHSVLDDYPVLGWMDCEGVAGAHAYHGRAVVQATDDGLEDDDNVVSYREVREVEKGDEGALLVESGNGDAWVVLV